MQIHSLSYVNEEQVFYEALALSASFLCTQQDLPTFCSYVPMCYSTFLLNIFVLWAV